MSALAGRMMSNQLRRTPDLAAMVEKMFGAEAIATLRQGREWTA